MLLSILILCHICKSENELQEDLNPQTIASSKKLKSYYCAITQVTGLPSSIITWQYDYLLANIKELQILNTPWANKTAANFLALFEQRDNGIKVCFIIFYSGFFLGLPVFFFFLLLKYSWFTMLYSFLVYSKEIQLYIFIYMTHTLFQVLSHYGLLQDIECSSLCCTVGPCCSLVLHTVVCICYSQTPNLSLPPHPPPFPFGLFSVSVSLFLLQTQRLTRWTRSLPGPSLEGKLMSLLICLRASLAT